MGNGKYTGTPAANAAGRKKGQHARQPEGRDGKARRPQGSRGADLPLGVANCHSRKKR